MPHDYSHYGLPENVNFQNALEVARRYLQQTYKEMDAAAVEDVLRTVNLRRALFILEHAGSQSEHAVTVALLGEAAVELEDEDCYWEELFVAGIIDLARTDYFNVSRDALAEMPRALQQDMAKLFLSEAYIVLDALVNQQVQFAKGILNNYQDYAMYHSVEPALCEAFGYRYAIVDNALDVGLKRKEELDGKKPEIPKVTIKPRTRKRQGPQ